MATMASLSLNSLPTQPPSQHFRNKLIDTSPSTSVNFGNGTLKPIVISGDPPTFVSAPGRRIVAVGDLHGDLAKAKSALELAGVLSSDGQDTWTGQETVLVQLGDILDRGEDEIAILSLLRSLQIQAKEHGGDVFQVNGNHETMNVEGDFRYVDSGAFDECSDFLEYLDDCGHNWDDAFASWAEVSETWKEERKLSQSSWGPWNLVKRQKGVIARSVLLRPGGPLASELARHPVVLKVDDWVFCHGGLLPHHDIITISSDSSITVSSSSSVTMQPCNPWASYFPNAETSESDSSSISSYLSTYSSSDYSDRPDVVAYRNSLLKRATFMSFEEKKASVSDAESWNLPGKRIQVIGLANKQTWADIKEKKFGINNPSTVAGAADKGNGKGKRKIAYK